MKKHFAKFVVMTLLLPSTVIGGGLVTNTNQSASFTRNPAQDAVIDATGTYYNPAGLAFLENGFHLSLSNQTITQTRTVSSTFPGLARTEFEGGVSAPLFPTFYAVYKTGPLALSLGINPIGGGGSANFENGLPSFDQNFALFANSFTAQSGIPTSYSIDAAFEGRSLNWGFQVNGSYALNENFAFSAGIRVITANNTYTGHLRNVMINPMHPLNPNGAGNMVEAPLFFNTLSATAAGGAQDLQEFIDNDIGGLTVNQLLGAGIIEQPLADQIIAGLGDAYSDELTIIQIQGAYNALAEQMAGLAAFTQAEFANRELDASQSGWGFAPIIGLNIKVSEELNIAMKYEHRASITMTNSTRIDEVGMYPDGAETANDMPAMLALGISYKPTPVLQLSAGMHYYFDKTADYGRAVPNDELIDNNFYELAFGVEYFLNSGLSLSAGYLRTQTGVNEIYHSDLSHSLSTNSIGGGLHYMINPNMGINLGVMSTMYDEHSKAFVFEGINYNEKYERVALSIGLGLDIKF